MSQEMAVAVAIAIVGMGLVFAAILVIWLFISLLMRWSAKTEGKSDQTEAAPGTAADRTPPEAGAEAALRQQAALAAVAVALALHETESRPQPFPVPPTALVSTWQAVRRAHQFGQRRGVR